MAKSPFGEKTIVLRIRVPISKATEIVEKFKSMLESYKKKETIKK